MDLGTKRLRACPLRQQPPSGRLTATQSKKGLPHQSTGV